MMQLYNLSTIGDRQEDFQFKLSLNNLVSYEIYLKNGWRCKARHIYHHKGS